ncbi:MAG TPA: ABC transporter permease [Anaerolineales bacterium]
MNSRLLSIIRKEFIQIFRDPRTLALILVMPIVQLFLLGYAATTDVKNVSLAVWDQSRTAQSRALLDGFRAADYFRISHEVYSQEEIRTLIESGGARAALIIPPDYDRRLLEGDAQVSMILDGSDATVGSTALSVAQLVGQSYAVKVLTDQAARQGRLGMVKVPLEVRTQVWYNPDLVSAYFMIPGMIGMILSMITSLLTAASIVRERERGTIEQLIVTPIRSWELVLAKISPYILVSFANTLLILALGTFWFGVPIRGSLLLLFVMTGLYLLPTLGLGLLISTVARTQQQAQLMTMPIMLPSMMLSGFIFPIASLPVFLQLIGYMLPLTYFIVVLRSIVIKGVGLSLLIPQAVALIVFAVLLLGLAAMRFRKSLD